MLQAKPQYYLLDYQNNLINNPRMTKAQKIIFYRCPVTGQDFPTQKEAEKCARDTMSKRLRQSQKDEKNQQIANSFRLELDSVQNFETLLNAKIHKHISRAVTIKAENFRLVDGDTIQFYISGQYHRIARKQFCITSLIFDDWGWSDTYKPKFKGFVGIETHSGGGGRSGWGYTASIKLQLFPLLLKKKQALEDYLAAQKVFDAELNAENERIYSEAVNQPEYKRVENGLAIQLSIREQAEKDIRFLRQRGEEYVKDYQSKNPPQLKNKDFSNAIADAKGSIGVR